MWANLFLLEKVIRENINNYLGNKKKIISKLSIVNIWPVLAVHLNYEYKLFTFNLILDCGVKKKIMFGHLAKNYTTSKAYSEGEKTRGSRQIKQVFLSEFKEKIWKFCPQCERKPENIFFEERNVESLNHQFYRNLEKLGHKHHFQNMPLTKNFVPDFPHSNCIMRTY